MSLSHATTTLDGGSAYAISHGVSGEPFNDDDITGADVAVSDVPETGKKLVFTDILISTDTAMALTLKDGTGGAVVCGPLYLSADVLHQVTIRGKMKMPTAGNALYARSDTAGNITIDPYYYSEL